MKLARTLAVSEIFGPTLQGEGPSTGKPAMFLRLGGCNLSCVWCDTPYTWDWTKYDPRKEVTTFTTEEVDNKLQSLGPDIPLLVITGGEPMLQQRSLYELTFLLPLGQEIEIETNGTITPDSHFVNNVDAFNVSPKLIHSGQPAPNVNRLFEYQDTHKARFKFVVQKPSDFPQIDEIVQSVGILPKDVWVMPEGTNSKQLQTTLQAIVQEVIDRRWNLSQRLHVAIWKNIRGH